jgi:hypothetical protein
MVNLSGLVLALGLRVAVPASAAADDAVPWRSQVFPCIYATLSNVERELIIDTALVAQASAMIYAAVERWLRESMNEVADLVPPDTLSDSKAESPFDSIDPIAQGAGAHCGVPDLRRGEVDTFKSYFLGRDLKNWYD